MSRICLLIITLICTAKAYAQTLEAVYSHARGIYDIHFLDEKFGYAVCDDGLVLQTRDAGKNWKSIQTSSTGRFTDIEFLTQGRGYICGSGGAFYRTNDSGKTWLPKSFDVLNWNEMHFLNKDTGYLIGYDASYIAYIHRTLDGGISWQQLGPLGTTNTQWDVHFHNMNRGFIASSGGTRFFSTADGGWNWNVEHVGTGFGLVGLSFPTPEVGYMSGLTGFLYKSSDSGITWTKSGLKTKTDLFNVNFYNNNIGWTAGFGDSLFITMNGGVTWNPMLVQSGSSLIYACQMLSPVYGWLIRQAPGAASTIYRYGGQQHLVEKSNRIRGRVFADKNGNCQMDEDEQPVPDLIMRTKDSRFYSYTNDSGNYVMYVDSGDHEIMQAIPPARGILLSPECPLEFNKASFNGYERDTTGLNFADKITLCPFLTVDVSSNRRRRCAMNLTVVPYANEGFVTAYNVKVSVEMPEFMHIIETSHPYTKSGGAYIFSLDSLVPGQRGQVSIIDSVACRNNLTGRTVCTRVGISPSNFDARAKDKVQHFSVPENIHIEARCAENGKAIIRIKNMPDGGGESMKSKGYLKVYIDEEIAFQDSFKLQAGDSVVYQIPYSGNSMRIEAEPDPNNPGSFGRAMIVRFLENCITGGDLGPKNKLPVNDDQYHYETQCMDVRDSYDPNDKSVVPEGITSGRYVKPGLTLDYLIRFQNTGSDTAYLVVIEDTLSEFLDVESLQAGASSYPYQLEIKKLNGKHLLSFRFSKINLPDSATNPLMSQGFVKYKIGPKAGVAKGSIIPNSASIFFDFNDPVLTNNAWICIYDTVLKAPPVHVVKCDTSSIPVIKLNTKDTLVCRGNTVLLQAKGADRYSWQPSATAIDSAHSAQEVLVLDGVKFKVTAMKDNSCLTATDSLLLRTAHPDTSIFRDGNVLKASFSNDSVSWLNCFDYSRAHTDAVNYFKAEKPGSYAAMVWKDGCRDTSSCTELNQDFYRLPRVIMNPAYAYIQIEAGIAEQLLEIEIYDMLGRRQKKESRMKPAHYDLFYRPEGMPPGIYFISIRNSAGVMSMKLIWEGE